MMKVKPVKLGKTERMSPSVLLAFIRVTVTG